MYLPVIVYLLVVVHLLVVDELVVLCAAYSELDVYAAPAVDVVYAVQFGVLVVSV